ncbi:MFS transporter [Catenuloplanes japonicus]|uniref:MFS transporter n=1 Tax=Catenuloplanes japonicus TaxID=33876 RepID=UPI00068EF6ED|nr:MFS transporter [Catenuloplanes japonicus]
MRNGRWWALAVLATGQLMVALDATIVNIALPAMQADLGFSDAGRQWVVTGYGLAFGSLLLLGGRLSDSFGRKRMLLIGFAGFAAASALGGAATGIEVLIAARVSQGVFAAMVAPAALSLLSVTFTDPRERGRAFGIFGAVTGSGTAVGLLLGGALTEYASWRWCLYVNLIFAAAGIAGAVLKLADVPGIRGGRLDWPGVLAAVAGLVALVYGLGEKSYAFAPAGLAILVVFVLIERRAAHPLLPLRVVLDRNRGGAYLSVGIAGAGMFGMFLFVTYYLVGTLGFSAVRTGLAFLPMIVGIMLTAVTSGRRLTPRFGPRPVVTAGALIAAAGMVYLTRLAPDSTYLTGVLPGMVVVGLGLGMIFSPTQNAATAAVPPHDAGVASAMINTAQQIGGAAGTALLTSVAISAADDVYRTIFWWSAGFFLLCAAVSATTFRSGPLHLRPGTTEMVAPAAADV